MKLFQLELDQSIVNCGMSYVIQLKDGTFVVIDGGYFTPGEDIRLYNFLRANSKTPWPIISGWIFTHAHQDHIGCFMNFTRRFLNDAIIDKLYFNFQPLDLKKAKGKWDKKSNDLATVKEFYRILESRCENIPIQTLKTGDTLEFAGVDIEVLCTADDINDADACFNDYSAVLSINVDDQRILLLGDTQKVGSKFLLENKMDKLKADIVQVAHHGFDGATKELYKAISPKVALFPCPVDEFAKNKSSEVNSCILNDLGVEEYYIGGKGNCEFNLPYTLGTAKQYDREFYYEPKKTLIEKIKHFI